MREDNPHTILSGDKTVGIFWNGEVDAFEPPKTRLFITDPPYNIGVKYGEGIFDRMGDEEYHQMIGRVLDSCFDAAEDDASLFLIHYPKAVSEMWATLTKKWEFRQWISWVYPTNTGHSKRKWTTAHRAIVWLTKGDPPFKNRAVTQNFKNPSVKVVKEKVAQGVDGVALYDWWEIPQVKNISEEYRGYENQIPSELIGRIVLSASEPGDWVADPFSGSFSTAKTAMSLGRPAWGCDINPEVARFHPKEEDWSSREFDEKTPHVDSGNYDGILRHITQEQLDRALYRLLLNASEDDLKSAIGRVNGPRVYSEIRRMIGEEEDSEEGPSLNEFI